MLQDNAASTISWPTSTDWWRWGCRSKVGMYF